MKHQAPDLPKFKRLSRRLSLPLYQSIGLLEAIWIMAQKIARDGDLTHLEAEDVAAWIEYPGDADELLEALVGSGWIDVLDDGRRVLHDWHEHAPKWLKGLLKSQGTPFASEKNTPIKEVEANSGDANRVGANSQGLKAEGSKGGGLLKPETLDPRPIPETYSSTSQPEEETNLSLAQNNGRSEQRPPPPKYSSDFESFWSIWPLRRVKKTKAYQAWKRSVKKCAPDEILDAARAYAESDQGRGEFCPEPASWLNAGRWEDDRSSWEEIKPTPKPKRGSAL